VMAPSDSDVITSAELARDSSRALLDQVARLAAETYPALSKSRQALGESRKLLDEVHARAKDRAGLPGP